MRILIITVSDTRTEATDSSGASMESKLIAAGFQCERAWIADERSAVTQQVESENLCDVLMFTGGTGVAPRDVTIESITPLLDKTLDGFGEAFRRLSWDQIGPRSILSRALAGTRQGKVIIALPGSVKAVDLALDAILIPLLEHMVRLARGEKHGH